MASVYINNITIDMDEYTTNLPKQSQRKPGQDLGSLQSRKPGQDLVSLQSRKPGQDLGSLQTRKPYVGILGAGSYGYVLAKNFQLVGTRFCVGTRNHGAFRMEGVDDFSYEELAQKCDVIFLCVPSHAFEAVISPIKEFLNDKVVVDISNLENKTDPSNAMRLQSMIPSSHVVKTLNNISAYYLEHMKYGGDKKTYVCGNDEDSKHKVTQILKDIGLTPIDRGLLPAAIALEQMPHEFFSGWGTAISITIATLVPLWLYYYLYIFWYNKEMAHEYHNDLPLSVSNRLIAWLMFWLLGLTYLPGVLADLIQLIRRSKYTRFPVWLDRWMRCRKQLGLICLLLACIHGCASCIILGVGKTEHHRSPNTTIINYQLLKAKDQVALLFAILALALMCILGISSLPSVSERLSWMEWNFIQRRIGLTTLSFGCVHVIAHMCVLWDPKNGWKLWEKHSRGIFPPPAFVMPILPLVVLCLRLIIMLPGISCYLSSIRSGRTGYKGNRAASAK